MQPYGEPGYYETEEVYETEPSREERSQYGSSAYQSYGGVYYAGPGYSQYGDYGGYGQPLEYEGYGEAYEGPRYHRGPSGFITRYTGPETRRIERPTFSWRPSAPRALRPPATRTHGPPPGWQERYGRMPVSSRTAAPSTPSRTVPPRVSKKQVTVKKEPVSQPVKPSSNAPTTARPSGSAPAKAPTSTKPVARARPASGAVGATGTPRMAPRTVRSQSAAPLTSIALTHAVSNAVKSHSTNQCPAIARQRALDAQQNAAASQAEPPIEKRVEVTVPREVAERESESRTESKSARAARKWVLPPRKTKSEKETRSVDVSKTIGASVEVKKTVKRVAVQEEVIEKEVNEEPRTEKLAVPAAETVVSEAAVNEVTIGAEPAFIEKDAAREEKAEEPVCETPVQNGTDGSSSVESMGASTEEMEPKEAMQGVPGATEVVYEDFGMSKKRIKDEEDRQERKDKEAALVTEADVVASISVSLDSGSNAALLVSRETTTEEVNPSVVKSIARLTVYEMLKDYKNGELWKVGPDERKPDREEAIRTPPVRDKMPLVDWELFRRRASSLAEKLALPSRYWDWSSDCRSL
ncbi:hypothetical protein PF004_g2088 [Phytophthora fragariae]|uniref:Uncharacterized protein n=1 Tax=Phytophthora fragariae TaxID=53985 RepID=A0A6G0PQJ3_9STRA|nr:hypothetical protein PF004_g2088 [Phytophthora fragariae]